jgi:protocatechuate 3,4-dioxygenase beta subunit
MTQTRPEDITAAAAASFSRCPDPRLRELLTKLVQALHQYAIDVGLTPREWEALIATLTQTGHITDDHRQEFILWSDTLGLSMLVDALSHRFPSGATESTVLGPFYVPGAPERSFGASLAEQSDAGVPVWVEGRVTSLWGQPLAEAEVDVWQNGSDMLYAVQAPETPEDHLRGRFRTRADGSYAFLGVRPVPYPIPYDGPVGRMLDAAGRHPWRPAHIHMIVRADGHQTLTTHIFDGASQYLDSDAVFAVKPSLLREFVRHPPGPDHPPGVDGEWYSVTNDIVLAPGVADEPRDPGRTA